MNLENNPKLTKTCMWLAHVTGTDLRTYYRGRLYFMCPRVISTLSTYNTRNISKYIMRRVWYSVADARK